MNLFDFLSRIGKARGFGIQSPWAYSFVREVIMEDLPYYAYQDIDNQYKEPLQRKRMKLYLRLRNYLRGQRLSIISLKDSPTLAELKEELRQSSILVLEDIYINKVASQTWKVFRDDGSTGITFDLYHQAICFPRSEMYKQHYKMNF